MSNLSIAFAKNLSVILNKREAVYVLFLKEKNQKTFRGVLAWGFDIIRSNIPFGSLDVCVLIKSPAKESNHPHR